MRYILIVFASRRDSLFLLERLQAYNIRAEITNTPRQLKLSCGISVKTSEKNINTVKRILYSNSFRTFSGIYLFDGNQYLKYN